MMSVMAMLQQHPRLKVRINGQFLPLSVDWAWCTTKQFAVCFCL
jgi:hypothetical protein